MAGVLPTASRFGAWANGPLNESVTGTVITPPSTTSMPSASSTPSSGGTGSTLTGLPQSSPSGGYGNYGGNSIGGGSVLPSGGIKSIGGGSSVNPMKGAGYGGNSGFGRAGITGAPMTGSGFGEAFDDGGQVDPAGDQQPTDPMSAIMDALMWGRSQMGLPASFYGSPTGDSQPQSPGFDDGGMIPSQDAGTDPTGQAVNPHSAIQYLTGTGGVSPDVATAVEQHVDPQGQMDPAERVLSTIMAAPDQQSKFGLMQHYRTRYNAYSGAARAAMDAGNMALAAHHATNAMANVPTGYNVKFAPARGGLAMMASKIGDQAPGQRGYGEGGEVDTDNPQVAMEQNYDDGGEVQSDPWDKVPMSENIEDRRNDPPSADAKDQMSAYDAAMFNARNPGTNARTKTQAMNAVLDKLGTQRGFDDGGEVDDEGDDGGTQMADDGGVDQTPADSGNEQVAVSPATSDGSDQPVMLTSDQAKQMLNAGYDKPVEQGWSKFLSDILSNLNPISSANAAEPGQAPQPPAAAPTTQQKPFDWTLPGGVEPDPNSLAGKLRSGVKSLFGAGNAQDVQTALPQQPQVQKPAAPGLTAEPGTPPPPTPQNPRGNWPTPAQRVANGNQPTPTGAPPEDPQAATLARLQKQADAIFGHDSRDMPGAVRSGPGIDAQKRAYIAKGMEAAAANAARLEQTNAMWGNRSNIENMKEGGRNLRNENTVNGREAVAQMQIGGRQLNNQQAVIFRGIINQLNQPGADPDKVMQQITGLAAQLGMRPQDVFNQARQSNQGGGQGGGQQQQSLGGPQIGDRKVINGRVYVWDGEKGVAAPQ